MAKLVLPRVSAGMGSVDVINSMAEKIEIAFDNTVSRDGALPNQLEAALDLNGQVLLNSGVSTDPNRLLTFTEMQTYVGGVASGLVVQKLESQTATTSQSVFNLLQVSYTPGANNLAVFVDGVRKFSPADYEETSSSRVTFVVPRTLGQKVSFVTNEFLGNINLPSHTHPWNQITGTPVYTQRWPTYAEVTDKPATFAPSAHVHAAGDITTGRLADARRGVYVQSSQPVGAVAGDLWLY